MNMQQAAIRCESGTVIRQTRGRRRPVYRTNPALASCPTCGWTDHADEIAAGTCARCAAIARKAARQQSN